MNIGTIKDMDSSNGPGLRVSLYVSGCTHKCPGCFNEQLWSRFAGVQWTSEHADHIMDLLDSPYISGLSLLGGEPMQNTDGLVPFVQRVRKTFGDTKTVWCWSGYTWEQIMHVKRRTELARLCDVVVDGKFVQALNEQRLVWRGSTNQRIVDVRHSDANHICELSEPAPLKELRAPHPDFAPTKA